MFEEKEKENNKKINIVIGITGGIAAYKSAELIRLLKKEGHSIKVMMTNNAERFITPLTLAVLSENRVYTELFSVNREEEEIRHISLAQWADLIIIAPATANTIAKMANGMADDILTSTVLAFPGKVYLAPAMNTVMINNSIYQDNVKYLTEKGYYFINAETGNLACGDYGDGRMAEPVHIVNFIKGQINRKNNLKDKKILISASATREPIDRVRFITNYSTGKMGFALAETAVNYGADVTLITGPTCLQDPFGARTIHVTTAEEMREQVMNYFMDSDVFISAAAVADFKPVKQYSGKIKKEGQETFTVKLAKNIDILKEAGEKKTNQILVGFAAEAQDLLENALTKLKTKKLDYIIANDITRKDSGFGTNTNKVIIIDNEGEKKDLPLMSKHKLAEHILNIIEIKLSNRHNGMLL